MYKKILVSLDGSELAECVPPHVESIVKGCGVQDIVFLRIVEPLYISSDGDDDLSEEDRRRTNSTNKAAAERYLSQLVGKTKYAVAVQSEIMEGDATDSIADYATKMELTLSSSRHTGVLE